MINWDTLKEDQALKRVSAAPRENKPRFDWGDNADIKTVVMPDIKVDVEGAVREFDLGEIADTIGNALTNLLLSRKTDDDIYSESNRRFVAAVASAVGDLIASKVDASAPRTISGLEVQLAIEKTLVEHNAHDVARSLVTSRSETITRTRPMR